MARLLARSLFVAGIALSITACKGKGAGGEAAKVADVDCDKMIDHMVDVLLREGTQGQSDAQIAAAKQKMKDQRPTMIAACVKEKPTKKLTQAQYDCLMKATSTAEMSGCQ